MTEGIDFAIVTEADIVMLRHALTVGVDDSNYSEFYVDEGDE